MLLIVPSVFADGNSIYVMYFNRITFLETHPDVMIKVVSIMHRTVDTQTTEIINYPIDRDAVKANLVNDTPDER